MARGAVDLTDVCASTGMMQRGDHCGRTSAERMTLPTSPQRKKKAVPAKVKEEMMEKVAFKKKRTESRRNAATHLKPELLEKAEGLCARQAEAAMPTNPQRKKKVVTAKVKEEMMEKVAFQKKRTENRWQVATHLKPELLEKAEGLCARQAEAAKYRQEMLQKLNNATTEQDSVKEAAVSLMKELLQKTAKPDKRTSRKERLSESTLKTIQDHKSSIAELRPSRRKIKWNNNVRNNFSFSRQLSELDLSDLQIIGSAPAVNRPQPGDPPQELPIEQTIQDLERKIRKVFKSLKREHKIKEKESATAKELEDRNKAMRKQLLTMPVPQRQSLRQSERQLSNSIELLQAKITEVDEQITMIDWQKETVENEMKQLKSKLGSVSAASSVASLSKDTPRYYGCNGDISSDDRASDKASVSVRSSVVPMPSDRHGGPMLRRLSATPAAA